MKVLELFAGTRSIGRAFAGGGHDVYSIEWDDSFPDISWYMDISKITSADILERFGKPDVIWASPDCTTYSIAGISHHRIQKPNGNLAPVSEYAKYMMGMDDEPHLRAACWNCLFALYMEIKHPELQDIPTRLNAPVPKIKAASEPCRRCKHRDRFGDEFPCDECVHRQNGTNDMFYPTDCKEDAEQ